MLFFLLLLPLFSSCNIYSPLTRATTVEDYLEEAIKCLNDGDFGCAVEQYKEIPDAEERGRRVCIGYLAKAGLTLKGFLNTVNQPNSLYLGTLAQVFVPWSKSKETDSDDAKRECATYAATATNTGMGSLLKFIGNSVHCALRMAKSDITVAGNNGEDSCNQSGNNDQRITKSDILNAPTGMCREDVTTCLTDNVELVSQNLADAGSNTKKNFDDLPISLKNASTTTTVGRTSLRDQVAAD